MIPMTLPASCQPIFERHLNQVFCLKSHLVERLPEIAGHAKFPDLRHAIEETTDDVVKQLDRLREIYRLLGVRHGMNGCEPLIGFIEAAFAELRKDHSNSLSKDLTIIYYLQIAEGMEIAAFRTLQHLSPLLASREIDQLLLECIDESRADKALLDAIVKNRLRLPS